MHTGRSFHLLLSTKPLERAGVGGEGHCGRVETICWKRIWVWGLVPGQEELSLTAWVTRTWHDVHQSAGIM